MINNINVFIIIITFISITTNIIIIVITLPISQRILYFSPYWFPWHKILKHASAVYAKHRQVPTNRQKNPFYGNFRYCESYNLDEKS